MWRVIAVLAAALVWPAQAAASLESDYVASHVPLTGSCGNVWANATIHRGYGFLGGAGSLQTRCVAPSLLRGRWDRRVHNAGRPVARRVWAVCADGRRQSSPAFMADSEGWTAFGFSTEVGSTRPVSATRRARRSVRRGLLPAGYRMGLLERVVQYLVRPASSGTPRCVSPHVDVSWRPDGAPYMGDIASTC